MVEQADEIKERMRQDHESTMKRLTDERNALYEQLKNIKAANQNAEREAYNDFSSTYTVYNNALSNYDEEMSTDLKEKIRETQDLKEKTQSLHNLQQLWQERLNERRKREELDNMIKQKKEAQEKEIVLMNKAATWLQAHWRGLVARKEYEKSKKKGRKRRGKGKK